MKIQSFQTIFNLYKPGKADNSGGESQGSTGMFPLQPNRCGSCEKCDKPSLKLSDFSCRRHFARRFC